jgi:hypothetical protein
MCGMGTNYTESRKYTCFNDCEQGGCPGHEMRIGSCRSSDVITVEIDGKPEYYFDSNAFDVLEKLMKCEFK